MLNHTYPLHGDSIALDAEPEAFYGRFDPDARYTPAYLDDCATCGREHERGELAWHNGELECAECEQVRAVLDAEYRAEVAAGA